MNPYDHPPRKVVIGTVIHGFWGDPADFDTRMATATDLIDRVAAKAEAQYPGRGVDLVALPENIITSGRCGTAAERAVDLEGPVLDTFAAKARQHSSYIVLPMVMADDRDAGVFANAAVLIGRTGEVVGIYRKVHVVAHVMTDVLEGGMTPGSEFPVFDCDFGRVGMQICYDMGYDDGWDALAAKGADIVVWPTASPTTSAPAARARRGKYFIVAATYRDNATIYEPTGLVAAQALPPEDICVHEIDTSSMVLPWSEYLRDGEGLREKFGDRVGFHYERMEDIGLFWSNDPDTPIGEMARQIDIREADEELERNRKLQDAARGGPPRG